MQRILLLQLLWIFPFVLSAQNDTLNQTDDMGRKQGYWQKKYPNGKLMYKGQFKDGVPVGKMQRFYESGELKAVLFYKPGKQNVFTRFFYDDGEVAAEGNYNGSLKDSVWTYYSYYTGAVTSREVYLNGAKQGVEKKYYENGQISEEIGWENSTKHGVWNQYFDDGKRKLMAAYANGKVNGIYTFFWPNGHKYITGLFVDNKRHGKWQFYNDEGGLKYEIEYHYGKAENEEELIQQDQEYFKMVDENIGKFRDPTMEDVFPGSGDYY